MLWTMGCLPTKVNTQTTHSCPSLKHAYTLTSTHVQYRNTTPMPVIPYLSLGFSCQDFRFLEIYLLSFVWGDHVLPAFGFPAHFSPSILCSYIPAPSLTSQIQSSEDICTSFSLNLHAFSRHSTTCHLRVPDNHSQRQIWDVQVGWVILVFVKATLWPLRGYVP